MRGDDAHASERGDTLPRIPRVGVTFLAVENFKGFRKFRLHLGGRDAYLVGPNNAGKSTLLEAARSAARMVRVAQREAAGDRRTMDGVDQWGHLVSSHRLEVRAENLRHEFTPEPTTITAGFGRDVRLLASWPSSDDNEDCFFWVKDSDVTLRRPGEVKRCLPRIAVLPVLSPLDTEERALSDSQISANLDSRLASRHFRNQLAYLSRRMGADALKAFFAYVYEWTPELEKLELTTGTGAVDLYYREAGGRHRREISWAGDGVQIWLQILLHLFRASDADVVVLDEPEVFLHPDLQHRLVQVLDSHAAQTIMATHSAEVLAEAPADSVFWIHRKRRTGIRKPDGAAAAELDLALGSSFNLGLARALKASTVVFVEGRDVSVLRVLGTKVGAPELGQDRRVTTIRLEGFDRWDRVEPFKWLVDELLGKHLTVYVLLDRDFRPPSEVSKVEAALSRVGVRGHVWRRHELENYLLVPSAIARRTGLTVAEITTMLSDAVATLEPDYRADILAAWTKAHPRHDIKRALAEAERTVGLLMKDTLDAQLRAFPGKELRARLNDSLRAAKVPPISDRALASELLASEVDPEMATLLQSIEATAH